MSRTAPLSSVQHQLWLLDQMQGQSTQYNLPDAFRVYGPLDVDALVGAFHDIIERHNILRSIIVSTPDGPVQTVTDLTTSIHIEDFSNASPSAKADAIESSLEKEWQQPFALDAEPPIRIKIIKLGDADHLIIRTIHHCAFDGWCHEIIDRELTQFYAARAAGRTLHLPDLRAQYSDFALLDVSRRNQAIWDRDLLYWRTMLYDAPCELSLPRDHDRQRNQAASGKGSLRVLSAYEFAQLKELSRTCGVTPFVVLFSLYAALLSYYCTQSDLVIGYPATNRDQSRFRELIGCFAKQVFLRVAVDTELTLRQYVARVNALLLDAERHQTVPFSVMVDELLGRERDALITPFFQATFAYQPRKQQKLTLPDVEVEAVRTGFPIRYDLELYCWRNKDELELHFLYNSTLFESWRIEQLADHFLGYIRAVLHTPELPLRKVQRRREHPALRPNGLEATSSVNQCEQTPDAEIQPIEQTACESVYILDNNHCVAMPGVMGEVYSSNRRSETLDPDNALGREIVVTDETQIGTRVCVYPTGDVGRLNPDGIIDVTARRGNYIKWRHMLINLDRIESLLKADPKIEDAAVTLASETDGRSVLVAYLHAPSLAIHELAGMRGRLHQKLPKYLVPERFVLVQALPHHPNGDVDRTNLQPSDFIVPSKIDGYMAPSTYLQEEVCRVYRDLLEIDLVGIHDNFFDLGGNSLLVVRLGNRIKAHFGISIPLQRLVEGGSPALVAEEIESSLELVENDFSAELSAPKKPVLRPRAR